MFVSAARPLIAGPLLFWPLGCLGGQLGWLQERLAVLASHVSRNAKLEKGGTKGKEKEQRKRQEKSHIASVQQ